MAWLPDWEDAYKRVITIDQEPGAPANYVVPVVVYAGSAPSSGTYTKQPSSKDTFLDEFQDDNNYGSDTWLMTVIAYLEGFTGRSIVELDISDLPSDAIIKNAKLKLYYYDYDDSDPEGRTIYAYQLRRYDWVESEATWNIYKTGSNWVSGGGDYTTSHPTYGETTVPASYGWMEWDITAIVKDAVLYGDSKVEVLIKEADETPGGELIFKTKWYSKDYTGDTSLRPKLEIEYGAEDNTVFLDDHCEDFPNDIRFTDNDGKTELDHWLNKNEWIGGFAEFGVRVTDSLDGSGTVNICTYYGKSGAASASSGDDTFDFFADFEGSDIDNDGTTEGFTVESGTWRVRHDAVYQDLKGGWSKDPFLFKNAENDYWLFFTESRGGGGFYARTGIARSSDKVHWKHFGHLQRFDKVTHWDAHVFKENGVYYLLTSSSPDATFEDNLRIVWWTSTDLKRWSWKGELFGPANWGDNRGVLDPFIYHEDSTWYLFYTVYFGVGNGHAIGYATTTDAPADWDSGSFTDQGELFHATLGWEGDHVYCRNVNKVDSTYYMHYSGGDSNTAGRIGYATASEEDFPDTWTKQGEITISTIHDWFAASRNNPHVLYVDGEWEMWFCGAEVSDRQKISYLICDSWPDEWTGKVVKSYRQTVDGDGVTGVSRMNLDEQNVAIHIKMKGTEAVTYAHICWRWSDSNYYICRVNASDEDVEVLSPIGGWHYVAQTDIGYDAFPYIYKEFEIQHFGTSIKALVNDVLLIDTTDSDIETSGDIKLYTYEEKGEFDEIRVRPYVYPEPAVSSVGSEKKKPLGGSSLTQAAMLLLE